MALEDVLAGGPRLRLLFGQVNSVVGSFVDIAYSGGVIQHAAKLDADTYSGGDYVAFLLSDEAGALILGKQTPGTPPPILPAPGSAVIVNAASYATYDSAAAAWTSGTLVQGPHQWACWFYNPADFTSLAGVILASFEIEVTRTSGGPPEFATHRNSTGTGVLDLPGDTYARDQPAAGVATWIKLPIDWGTRLVSGTIKGIAVGGGMNSGAYSGTGRARITPV